MNKILITLAILGAIGIMLAQVNIWNNVAEEYKPLLDLIPETQMTDAASTPAAGTVDPARQKQEADIIKRDIAMPAVDSSAEIDNTNYAWLKTINNTCGPMHKDNLRMALNNDGIIRENEYHVIIESCNAWSDSQQSTAKQELNEFVK